MIDEAQELLGEAAPPTPSRMNLLDRAELVRRIDGQALTNVVKARCGAAKHALGHSLLNALGCRQNVTTNFDNCFELAAEVFDDLVVLPEARPRPD